MAPFGASNLPMHGEPSLFPTQSMVLVFAKTKHLKIVIVGLKNKSKIQKEGKSVHVVFLGVTELIETKGSGNIY
jgi:hypothetical protein